MANDESILIATVVYQEGVSKKLRSFKDDSSLKQRLSQLKDNERITNIFKVFSNGKTIPMVFDVSNGRVELIESI